MARGSEPRISSDPSEERMVTWRLSGNLHKLLIEVSTYLGMSHNRYLTEVMTVKLHEMKNKIDETEAKKNTQSDK